MKDWSEATWQKSRRSAGAGACVEVAVTATGSIAVRDSKDPDGPVLEFTPDEWDAFLDGARRGEFNNL